MNITITVYSGEPQGTERTIKSLTLSAGILMPVKLDEWAKGALAFALSAPENAVLAPPDLVQRVREAEALTERHHFGRPVDGVVGTYCTLHDCMCSCADCDPKAATERALLALGRAVYEQTKTPKPPAT